MSTYFVTIKPTTINEILNMCDMSEGRVREEITEDSTSRQRCFTDGKNYIWCYMDEDGIVVGMSRYGRNNESFFIDEIENVLAREVISEHDKGYDDVMETQYQ